MKTNDRGMAKGYWYVVVWLVAEGAWAQATEPGRAPTEADFFAEQPVVLSASRLLQPVSQAPAAVTVIDRAMIEASGFRTIPDLLRLVPGFEVNYARGGFPSVSYQGLSNFYSKRMQVMVDGRSIYNTAYGHVTWNDLPLAIEDIERIEVVRGPNAPIDGTNAVQATVHIITRHSAQDKGWLVSGSVGDHGVRDALLKYVGAVGDLSYRLSVMQRSDDWYDSLPDKATDRFVNLRADYQVGNQQELTFQFGHSESDWHDGLFGSTSSPPHSVDPSNTFFQLRWRRVLDADNEWSLQAHHSSTRTNEAFTARLAGKNIPMDLSYRLRRDAVEYVRIGRVTPSLRASWGGEVRYEAASSRGYTDSDATYTGYIYRLFGNAEWEAAPHWLLHAGAMLEKNYYAGTRLSPRLAVNYLPSRQHAFRAAVSRGYRTPTFLEQNADIKIRLGTVVYDQQFLALQDLKPESILTRELGYYFQNPEWGVRAEVRLFRNDFGDMVDFVAFPSSTLPPPGEVLNNGYRVYANNVATQQQGAEYQIRWQPLKSTWFMLNQSWVSNHSNSADYAASTPSMKLALLASHDFGSGWAASLGYYRIGTMKFVGTIQPIKEHERMDMRFAKRWKMSAGGSVEAALVLQNLLADYVEYYTFGVPRVFDRRAFATLKINL